MKFEAELKESEHSAVTLVTLCSSFLSGVYQRPVSYIVAVIVFVTTDTQTFYEQILHKSILCPVYILGHFRYGTTVCLRTMFSVFNTQYS